MPVGVALKCVAWSAGVALVASGAGPAQAVDGTWVGAGSEWTTGTNWSSTPVVPDGTATFTNNGAPTAVTISNSTSIDTMEFTAAAPAYSFTVTNGASFAINNSDHQQLAVAAELRGQYRRDADHRRQRQCHDRHRSPTGRPAAAPSSSARPIPAPS